jgi:two-component system, LuxR family, sensor kinase FixL
MRSISASFDTGDVQASSQNPRVWNLPFDFRTIVTGACVFVGYYLGARVGFALTFQPHPVSVLWPPNSILVAALLLTPPRMWWFILLAAFPAHCAAQLQSHVPPLMILCWFISNSCEALISAGLTRYLVGGPIRFRSLRDAGVFCLCAVIIGPFLSSFLDAAFVVWNHLGQDAYWKLIRIRFSSNALAAVIVVPLIVTWARNGIPRLRRARLSSYLEACVLFLSLCSVSYGVLYKFGSGADSALLFLPLPFLLWAALRFGSLGASSAISIVGFLAIWSGSHGHGPFSGGTAEENALSIQIFLIALAIPLMFLAAVIEERVTADAELRETHQRVDLAASAAELGFWLWDIVRDEIWFSEKERALFGFEPSEKVDIDRFRKAIHPDDRDSMRKAVENSLNAGMEYEAEHRVILPNGQIRWLATRGRVEFSGDGKPTRMRGVSLDVTPRKLGEEALSESEERFRIVADAAPVLIWMAGVDKLCTFFNKPWLEFTGRSIEQELGNGWAEGVHPDDLQKCLEVYTQAFDARQPFVMQYRLRRNDGEYRWVSDQGVARHTAQGGFAGYIGSCVDVTELMRKEEALREFEERVVLAAQAAHLGVWEMDPGTNEVWMSDSARTLFQFDSETHLDHAAVQNRVHPEDRALRDCAVKHAIETQGGYEIEYRLLLPDGTLRWMASRGRYLTGTNRKGARLIGVSRDITPRKLAEAEALQHREELGHLSRVAAMGELAASIAHELNQPLSGITSNASAGQRFIDRGDVDLGELRDLLGDIMTDGRRAGDVIRGIQSMVKKGVPTRQRVNLNDLVTNVARIVNPNAMLQSCKVETLLEPDLPAIEADPIQLQQVLLNLVINSFDAMRDMPVSRRKVVIVTERNAEDAIRASVRDYGVGISEESRDRLFDHFFTTKAQGLGMGLAIVRSIVESHGGTIAAENVEGGGARFYFALPAKPKPLG